MFSSDSRSNDQYHQIVQQPDADHALFTVVFALIFKQHQGAAENLGSVGEVKAVFF